MKQHNINKTLYLLLGGTGTHEKNEYQTKPCELLLMYVLDSNKALHIHTSYFLIINLIYLKHVYMLTYNQVIHTLYIHIWLLTLQLTI